MLERVTDSLNCPQPLTCPKNLQTKLYQRGGSAGANLPSAQACASRTLCSGRPRTRFHSRALWWSRRSHAAPPRPGRSTHSVSTAQGHVIYRDPCEAAEWDHHRVQEATHADVVYGRSEWSSLAAHDHSSVGRVCSISAAACSCASDGHHLIASQNSSIVQRQAGQTCFTNMQHSQRPQRYAYWLQPGAGANTCHGD